MTIHRFAASILWKTTSQRQTCDESAREIPARPFSDWEWDHTPRFSNVFLMPLCLFRPKGKSLQVSSSKLYSKEKMESAGQRNMPPGTVRKLKTTNQCPPRCCMSIACVLVTVTSKSWSLTKNCQTWKVSWKLNVTQLQSPNWLRRWMSILHVFAWKLFHTMISKFATTQASWHQDFLWHGLDFR